MSSFAYFNAGTQAARFDRATQAALHPLNNAGTQAALYRYATQAPNHSLFTAVFPAAARVINPVNMQRQVE